MRLACCAILCWWALTIDLPAARPTTIKTISLAGRTSLVFPARVDEVPSISRLSPYEFRVAVHPSEPCEPARYRASVTSNSIQTITVRCPNPQLLEATIVTTMAVEASGRSTSSFSYVDIVPASGRVLSSGVMARRVDGSGGSGSGRSGMPAVATSDVARRASGLAESGRVRELMGLIDSLSPLDKAQIQVHGISLEALLDTARQRKLDLDRELFLKATPR